MRTHRELIREAAAILEGRTPAPDGCETPAARARHEAGHAVVAWRLGVPVVHVAIIPTPGHPDGGHTQYDARGVPDVRVAAVLWAGPLAQGTLATATADLEKLAAMRHHFNGPAFALARNVLAENRDQLDLVAVELQRARRHGVLFGEELADLLGRPGTTR